MKILKLWRTFKEGFHNFYRNGWLSVATTSIMTLSLFILGVFFMITMASNVVLKDFQGKINLSVFFNSNVSQDKIMEVKSKLENTREIKTVRFVSKNEALDEMRSDAALKETIDSAVEQLGENPLPDSLVITANDSSQYGEISKAINNDPGMGEIVSHVNYEENKKSYEQLSNAYRLAREFGVILGAIFIVISILITFNTIRITMYSHRQEFEIMRLVGASNVYVKMPMVFEGIFYGFFSAFLASLLLFISIKFILPAVSGSSGFSGAMSFYAAIGSNYMQYFGKVFFSMAAFGIIIGTVSGLIAIRRYLKV